MRDFDLIVHQFYGGHDVTIVPVADTHLGAPECMEQEFIKFITEVKNTPDLYLILGGGPGQQRNAKQRRDQRVPRHDASASAEEGDGEHTRAGP